MRILAIAFAFALIGCVDETTPEGIDDFEEEFDDLGPDTHKSDVDQTTPGEDTQTQRPFSQELAVGGLQEVPRDVATTTQPVRDQTNALVETRGPLESREPTNVLVETTPRTTPPSRTPAPRL
jgi:hypothetical protein